MQQQQETLDPKEQVARMDALYKELMEEYKGIVLPWGFGHGMPDAISEKATGVMNHAWAVLKKMEELCKEHNIQRPTQNEPNANMVLLTSHQNTVEFRTSIAQMCEMTETEMSEFIAQEVYFFLEENDPNRKAEMLDSLNFWGWIYTILHGINVMILALTLKENAIKDPMLLRQHLKQGICSKLGRYETSIAYFKKFPNYYKG